MRRFTTARRIRPVRALPALMLLAVIGGCVTPPVSMETPRGFAAFSDEETVRVISPEGVLMRVRTVENEPPQTLQFWAEVLERQLLESGYQLVDRGEFDARSGPGIYLEWLAPVGVEDFIYLTGISVGDDQIVIVEAAGATSDYSRHRDRILESMASVALETTSPGEAGGE